MGPAKRIPNIQIGDGLEVRERYVILRWRSRLSVKKIARQMGHPPDWVRRVERGEFKNQLPELAEYWGDL